MWIDDAMRNVIVDKFGVRGRAGKQFVRKAFPSS